MRLVQFTAADGWRGHEQKIIYLYEAFRDFGYVEDQWIVCRNDSAVLRVSREKGLQALGYDFKSEYDLKFAKVLAQKCRELRADIVFIHSSKAHTIAVLAKMFFGLDIPLVLCRTMIERVDTNFFRKWKYNYKGIDKIICVSQPVVDILKFAVRDHSRLRIVGSVTDVARFPKTQPDGMLRREFGIPDDHAIVGNISAFQPMKDIPTWVRTAAELLKRGRKMTFVLVGEGGLEKQIREMVAELGIDNHVIFTGFRRDIPDVLPEFDLLLFTSDNEPTGGVILESYACHVPVVATRAGGIPTIVEHEVTGLLAQMADPVDFADNVERMLDDAELRKRCVENGYRFLMATSTKEVISKQMIDELQEVLDRYPNRKS
ncbi:MAG TPA: glycosyltransferase family 4 protein [Flavobacterium sp.]|nr:glycosyltransferase family 4 protein [Flavobacterium sp.]